MYISSWMKKVEVVTVYWVDQLLTCPQMSHTFPTYSLKALHCATWFLENEAINTFILLLLICVMPSWLTWLQFISPLQGELFPVTVSQLSCLMRAKWSQGGFTEGRKTVYQRDQSPSSDRSIEVFGWFSYLGGWKEENVWQAVKLKNTNSYLDLELMNLVELIRI